MAVYSPAATYERARETVWIHKSVEVENVTLYDIVVSVPPQRWHFSRRYKEFDELNEKLTKHFAVPKGLLPPKKFIGNRNEKFIFTRQKELEIYLQTLVYMFSELPEPLAVFLDFPKFEIRFITSALSEKFFTEGDSIISSGGPFQFSVLQLNAISERLKLTEPTCYSNNPKQDLAHLVEFATRLTHLKILGGNQPLPGANFFENSLTYELSMFKSVQILEMSNCRCDTTMSSVGHLRPILKSLTITKTLDFLSQFFLCDTVHWSTSMDIQSWPTWDYVTHADFSNNKIFKIESCIKLLPNVQHLNLSRNEIKTIENLESLSDLSILNLSHNSLTELDSLHTCLGNIHVLNLASNYIKSLHGLSKLFSVSELILENNKISSMSELQHLSQLPCLENLNLQHNPVTFTVDYRPQLLLMLSSIAPEIVLDGQKATEKEIDTVSVLQALQLARQETNSKMKSNSEDIRTYGNVSGDNFSIPPASSLLMPENNSTTKVVVSNENSQFRHQVESLRKIGGSDWLKLLNEMHCPSPKNKDEQVQKDCDQEECTIADAPLESACSTERPSKKLTPQVLKSITFSYEISFPEWLVNNFDPDNNEFKYELMERCEIGPKSFDMFERNDMSNANVLWVTLIKINESSRCETPACILVYKNCLYIFKFKRCGIPLPDFQFLRLLTPMDIVSTSAGPLKAYVELQVKKDNNAELLIMLLNPDSANYAFNGKDLLFKFNPFANSLLCVDNIDIDITQSPISKQIIFGQRVCVSKVLHDCEHDVIHYICITSSHVLLVEERLPNTEPIDELLRKLMGTTIKPQFKVCTLINVHTNIKQIHLKDVNSEDDYEETDVECYDQNMHSLLYTCGCWLTLEFEPNTVLCISFYNGKQRNEFLNAFLGARRQK